MGRELRYIASENKKVLSSTLLPQRRDILAVTQEINRLENNIHAKWSIKNRWKANKIHVALKQALENQSEDVTRDEIVRTALATHRIFGFFGFKTANALRNVDVYMRQSTHSI